MRGLRFSVGDAMFWVGLVAVDCGLIRPVVGNEYLDALRALSLLPAANVLPILARRLVRRPASRRPVAVGFLAGGVAAVAGLLALGWSRGAVVDPVTLAVADGIGFPLGQLGLGLHRGARSLAGGSALAGPLQAGVAVVGYALALLGVTLPQWSAALLGGALAWAGARAWRRMSIRPEVG